MINPEGLSLDCEWTSLQLGTILAAASEANRGNMKFFSWGRHVNHVDSNHNFPHTRPRARVHSTVPPWKVRLQRTHGPLGR